MCPRGVIGRGGFQRMVRERDFDLIDQAERRKEEEGKKRRRTEATSPLIQREISFDRKETPSQDHTHHFDHQETCQHHGDRLSLLIGLFSRRC